MRVVVTGATGIIGTSLLEALTQDPQVTSVVAVARRPAPELPLRGVEWVACDLSRDDPAPALAGADAVVHLAWRINSRDRRLMHRVNVEGSARLWDAARRAGVRTIVYASSMAAYSPGPKDQPVSEDWPVDGIPGFSYSQDKVAVEAQLAALGRLDPGLRVVVMRPVLVVKASAAAHLRRQLLGPLVPSPLLRPGLLRLVPRHPRLRLQVVHASDVAEAFRLALHADAEGPFNLAADPVLDGPTLARLLGARTFPVSSRALRTLHAAAHRLRLVPGLPGWTDDTFAGPVVDAGRARRELGWTPQVSAEDATLELLRGLRGDEGAPTPALDPRAGGRLRVRELLGATGRSGS